MRPRGEQVEADVVGTYHCTSRCVRRAFLLSASEDVLLARKPWIERRLKALASIFAVEVDTFSVMDNHLHLLLTIRPDVAKTWTDREVATRWLTYLPPSERGVRREATEADVEAMMRDRRRLASCRRRLCALGEFHKAVKEPLARLVNREEDVTGHFWEGRYRSRRVLDRAAMLATMAYVDLNPVRAGIARTPEESRFTGVRHRVEARSRALARMPRRERDRLRREAARRPGWERGCLRFAREPAPSFLTPIASTPERRGVFEDLELDEYLTVLDRIGRRLRKGKSGRIPDELAPILERLGVDAESFGAPLGRIADWFGSVVGKAASCVREARRCGRKRVISALNLDGS